MREDLQIWKEAVQAAGMQMKVAIPDLISPSYFPAIAAVELGFFERGLDATLELLYPVTKTYEELREGRLDFVGGAAHAALYAFKDWQGGQLLCALGAAHVLVPGRAVRSEARSKGDLPSSKDCASARRPGRWTD